MTIIIFDIIILFISALLFLNFKRGFIMLLCARMAMPSIIRFVVGPLSISNVDFFSIVLIPALFFCFMKKHVNMPKAFVSFFTIDILACFLLILLSTKFVPIEFQFVSFVKNEILQGCVFCIAGYYALSNIDIKNDFRILWMVAIICGVYGIFAYFINLNPYITGLSVMYNGEEDVVQNFLDETRAGLEGRAYGTTEHPLAWGQLWNLLVIFIVSFKKKTSWYFYYPILTLAFVNIFLCGSRSALIVLLLSLSILCLVRGAIYFTRLSLGLLFAFICFLMIAGNTKLEKNDMVKYVFATVMFWDDDYARDAKIIGSSSSMRNNQLEESINIAIDNPFGVGYDYQSYATKTEKRLSNELMGLESVFFKKLVEQGFGGLLLFFICLLLLYVETRKHIVINKEKYKLIAFTTGYLASISFTGMQGISWNMFVVLMFCYYHYYVHANMDKQMLSYNYNTI